VSSPSSRLVGVGGGYDRRRQPLLQSPLPRSRRTCAVVLSAAAASSSVSALCRLCENRFSSGQRDDDRSPHSGLSFKIIILKRGGNVGATGSGSRRPFWALYYIIIRRRTKTGFAHFLLGRFVDRVQAISSDSRRR